MPNGHTGRARAARRRTPVVRGDTSLIDDPRLARLRDRRLEVFLEAGQPGPLKESPDALIELIERTARVFADSLTLETRNSYISRWNDFEHWAAEAGFCSLPARPETVMLYLRALIDGDATASISTVRGRLAAINRVHMEAGEHPPGHAPVMTVFLRGLVRIVGPTARRSPVKALRVHDLREVARSIPMVDARRVRDRAALALHVAGMTDAGIARLQWKDLSTSKAAITALDRGSPDEAARVRLRDTAELIARSAVLDWMNIATPTPTSLFNTTDAHGHRSVHCVSAADIESTRLRRLDSFGLPDDTQGIATAFERLGLENPHSLRDRALLLVGFAAAFRCVDLTTLRWSDITDDPDGLVINLRYSKTDRSGRGRLVGIPYGKSRLTCPVTAMQAWRSLVQDHVGVEAAQDMACFVRVGRGGRIGPEGMRAGNVRRVVRDRTREAGLVGSYGGRSLRAGFITTAADLDIPLELIAQQSGHKTLDNLILYIRREDPFHRNAAGKVGL